MRSVEGLSQTRWECKYHIVFIPKYRRKAIFGQIREDSGLRRQRRGNGGGWPGRGQVLKSAPADSWLGGFRT